MELKDVILSTLAEMEEQTPTTPVNNSVQDFKPQEEKEQQEEKKESVSIESIQPEDSTVENELHFLHAIRERLLVLFEGFQAPNNANIEAKIDMTLNFLEYTLATIDERVEKLEKGMQK